jgi:hypothetical protein
VSRSRWRLFSAALATIALAVTAMVADSATAAVPSPPTSVTARAGDHLAEVTWTAPTPDDPTITGYTITASPADTPPVTVGPTARTATVTGLTNGTAYSFTVAAINPDGPSSPSDPSTPVTPQPARRHHPHPDLQPDQRPPRWHCPAVRPPPAGGHRAGYCWRDALP